MIRGTALRPSIGVWPIGEEEEEERRARMRQEAQDTHHSLPRGISPWRGIKRGSRGIGSQRQTARVTSRCRSIGDRPSKRNGTCVT